MAVQDKFGKDYQVAFPVIAYDIFYLSGMFFDIRGKTYLCDAYPFFQKTPVGQLKKAGMYFFLMLSSIRCRYERVTSLPYVSSPYR